MSDNRAQAVNIKVPTDFGTLHFTVKHDEQCRATGVYWATNDDLLHEGSQIGKLLKQCTEAINTAINDMNADWSSKWDLKRIAELRS